MALWWNFVMCSRKTTSNESFCLFINHKPSKLKHLFIASMLHNLFSPKSPAWFPFFSLKSNSLAHSVPSLHCGTLHECFFLLLPHSLLCRNVNALKQQPENFLCATRVTEKSELRHSGLAAAPQPRTREAHVNRGRVAVCQDIEMGRDGGSLVSMTDGRKGLTSTPAPHPLHTHTHSLNAIASAPVLLSAHWVKTWRERAGRRLTKNTCGLPLAQKHHNRHASAEFSDPRVGCMDEKHPALKNSTPRMTQKTLKAKNTGELQQELRNIVIQANFCGFSVDAEYFSKCSLNLRTTCAGYSHCPAETKVIIEACGPNFRLLNITPTFRSRMVTLLF